VACFRFALGHHLFQHPPSPYHKKNARDAARLLPRVKEQAPNATTTTHPLFMAPAGEFTSNELKEKTKMLTDKSLSRPSGITNQVLQAGDTDFQAPVLIFFNGLWESQTQPTALATIYFATRQPIYEGHNKDKSDPASYRGICFNDTLAKVSSSLPD